MHLGNIEIGDIRVDAIDGGAVWMDGGAIFGIVPKPLWCQVRQCDLENRVRLSFFSLLVRTGDVTAVIEGGSAAHQPPKAKEHYAADESRLMATLALLGVRAEDVDFFIPSHLHFDHAGGASTPDGKGPVFPNAQYVLQRREWDEARNPCPINRNAYLAGDIAPLEKAKLLIVDGSAQIVPGIEVAKTGGHSYGHQMVKVGRKPSESIVFIGDIIPTSEHISPRWLCAFDIEPAVSYDVKLELLARAAGEGTLIAPGHGGKMPILRVECRDKGRYTAEKVPQISAMQ